MFNKFSIEENKANSITELYCRLFSKFELWHFSLFLETFLIDRPGKKVDWIRYKFQILSSWEKGIK